MNRIGLYTVRLYLRIGLFFYFKTIKSHNLKNIPKHKSVLFLANHQNALLDALLIATQTPRFSFFLTRAGVFKNVWIRYFLKKLQMLPVYRIRDGWQNLSNNEAIFNTCSKLLNKKQSIVIFPEGNHNLKRTVRSLSKGFTRIIFETLEQYPNTDITLVPVGLNYLNAEQCPDSVALFFGTPIQVKTIISEQKHTNVSILKSRITHEIAQLTTHIPSENYDAILKTLNDLKVDFLNPKAVNHTINNNFKTHQQVKVSRFLVLKPLFKMLLIVCLLVPYVLWKFLVLPKIKQVEFISTFRFAVAITLVPFWVIVVFIGLTVSFGILFGLAYLFIVLGLVLSVVKA